MTKMKTATTTGKTKTTAKTPEKSPVGRKGARAPARGKKRLSRLLIPAAALLLALALNFLLVINAQVPTESMSPTLAKNSLVLFSRLAYLSSEPQVGDIVVFRHAEFGRKLLVKRVAAVGGQRIAIRGGRVSIDGKPLDEPYVAQFSKDDFPETTVPAGALFVLGDNRCASRDSRFWKDPFVRVGDVKGKALFAYFPRIKKLS